MFRRSWLTLSTYSLSLSQILINLSLSSKNDPCMFSFKIFLISIIRFQNFLTPLFFVFFICSLETSLFFPISYSVFLLCSCIPKYNLKTLSSFGVRVDRSFFIFCPLSFDVIDPLKGFDQELTSQTSIYYSWLLIMKSRSPKLRSFPH